MSNLLSTGLSALQASQAALNTASHNIANANTAGYTRQRVELVSRQGADSGSGYIGSGVGISTVRRITDSVLVQRLQTANAAQARAQVYSDYAARIDTLLSDSGTSLNAPLQDFFSAANDLAQNPGSAPARQALLGSAQTLSSRFATLQEQLDGFDRALNSSLQSSAVEINQYTRELATLNQQIVEQTARAGGQPPNDLLDQRDQLAQQIAARIGISTRDEADGSLSVFTGSGQALVVGAKAGTLATATDAFGSGSLELTLNGQVITPVVSGGSIGGLLDTRRELLEPARSELGRLAAGLAQAVNQQNAAGVDALGRQGGALLTQPVPRVQAATANTGTAALTAQIDDLAALDGSNYILRYDGSAWSATDARTGSAVALSGSGGAADPLRLGGLTLSVGGSAQAGDRFLLEPTADAAGQLKLATSDPSRIAAANAVRVSAASGNSAAAASIAVSDAGNAALLDPVTITFSDSGTYQINGSGSHAYSAGTPISVNGWSLNLSGTPAAGDSFSVAKAATGSADNSNAQKLARLGELKLFDGGSTSLAGAQTALESGAGSRARQAGLQLDAQTAVKTQAQAARESVAGVNLDEEAADLIRFQQAYQAAAQVIQVANQLFQSLLDATRG